MKERVLNALKKIGIQHIEEFKYVKKNDSNPYEILRYRKIQMQNTYEYVNLVKTDNAYKLSIYSPLIKNKKDKWMVSLEYDINGFAINCTMFGKNSFEKMRAIKLEIDYLLIDDSLKENASE